MPTKAEPNGALSTRWERVSLENPVLLAGAPALGYAIAYLDHLGAALVYGIPLGAIIVAAWAAHVKMAPQLRSRLSFELKFQPKKIKFWAGRGMHAT